MNTFSKNRIETFSDGVIAIVITIMVLNIPLPDTFGVSEILGVLRSVLIFFVSFFIVGSHWNYHHILFERVEKISSKIVWRNLLYLFFISLIPIFTKWVMQHPDDAVPAIGYDIVFLLVSASYQMIWNSIIQEDKSKQVRDLLKSRQVSTRFRLWRWGIMILFAAAIILLSYFYPRFSLIFLIGLPVTVSLFNIIVEREEDSRFSKQLIAKRKNVIKANALAAEAKPKVISKKQKISSSAKTRSSQ